MGVSGPRPRHGRLRMETTLRSTLFSNNSIRGLEGRLHFAGRTRHWLLEPALGWAGKAPAGRCCETEERAACVDR